MLPNEFNPLNVTLAEYNKYRTTYPAVEVIGGMLWDTVAYTSAATLRLQLFNAARATPNLSNLATPGILTNNTAFLIRAVRFRLLSTPRSTARAAAGSVTACAVDDLAQLMNTGFFQFTISAKPYMQFPLWFLPSGCGPWGMQAADGNTADPGLTLSFATAGVPQQDNAFILTQPLFIAPMVNFFADLIWPAGSL